MARGESMIRVTLVAAILSLTSLQTTTAETVAFTDLQLNGNATLIDSGDTLRLASANVGEAGSAFIPIPFTVRPDTAFTTSVQFRLTGGTANGADGFAFVVQSDVRGASAVGRSGGDLGYYDYPTGVHRIQPSIAVEFDTHRNSVWRDPSDNHVGIDVDGSVISVATAIPSFSLSHPDSRFAWIDYKDGVLKVFLSEVNVKPTEPILSHAIDLAGHVGSKAYFGFTAGTGAGTDNHDIEAWEISVTSPFAASAFQEPMGKRKKIGSTLPVKFQLFFSDIPIMSQDELDVVLELCDLAPACPEIVLHEVTNELDDLIQLPDDGTNVGEGGDLGFCFRFDDDGQCIYNLRLDSPPFLPNSTYIVEVLIGDIVLQPDNSLFQTK